jgi:DNA-binding CsgD family transcriptional regulator
MSRGSGQTVGVELPSSSDPPDAPGLSPSERRVLELARSGSTARQVADQLSLSEATVRTHLSHIYAKFGVRGRLELLAHLQGTPMAREEPPPHSAAALHRLADGASGGRAAALGPIIMSVIGAIVGAALGWAALPATARTPLAVLLIPAIAGAPVAIAVARRPGGLHFFAAVAGVAGAILVALSVAPGLSCPNGEFASTCVRPAVAPVLLPGLMLVIAGLLIAGAAGRSRVRGRSASAA